MRAWRVQDGALTWETVPQLVPRAEESLVDVALSGVCGSDLAKLSKSPMAGPSWAWRPGHEIVGRLRGGPPDSVVVVDPLVPCEDCDRCMTGDIHLCRTLRRVGWDLPGGFAEQVVAPCANIVRLPDGLGPAAGVLADSMAVAIHGLRCGLPDGVRSRLAVVGSGPLALCSAAWASAHGWSVTMTVRDIGKVAEMADLLDVSFATADDASARSFDVVVDAATGLTDAGLRTALRLVGDGGVVLVQNAYDTGVRLQYDLRDIFRRSIRTVGSFSYCRRHGKGDFQEGLDFLARRPAWTAPVVRHVVPIESLPEAVSPLTDGPGRRPIKVVLTTEGHDPE